MALSSLTGEMATFTSRVPSVGTPNSSAAIRALPSTTTLSAGVLPGAVKPRYSMASSRLCSWRALIGREKRTAKYNWRPGAQPRVSRMPVSVVASRTRRRDHRFLPA